MTGVEPGAVVLQTTPDGVKILEAPDVAVISLELIPQADPALLQVKDGDVITLCGVVDYHVVGWDPSQRGLLLELVDDRRTDG